MTDAEEIAEEIAEAVRKSGIDPSDFHSVAADESQRVVRLAMERFVVGNPRVWWLSLAQPAVWYPLSDGRGYQQLESLTPREEFVWFIPETGEDFPPVFRARPSAIPLILDHSFDFEYYVLGNNLDWLFFETDHHNTVGVVRR